MPERWREELRKLARVQPSGDLWERAQQSPGRTPDSRGRSRLTGALAALLVVALAGVGLWWAFRPTQPARPVADRTPAGSYLLLPDQAGPPQEGDANGGATLTLATDLPNGTMVLVGFDTGGGTGGFACCPVVQGGNLVAVVGNQHCLDAAAPQSDGFSVALGAAPAFTTDVFVRITGSNPECPGTCRAATQPASVLQSLGDHFESLTGDQVTKVGQDNVLIARSGLYAWPPDTCGRANASHLTESCVYQEPLLVALEPKVEPVASGVIQAINEFDPCLLYGDASDAYKAAESWLAFRDRFAEWVGGLGNLEGQPITLQVVDQSEATFDSRGVQLPESFVADYFNRGTLVAEVAFVHVSGEGVGPAPQYKFTRLDLFDS